MTENMRAAPPVAVRSEVMRTAHGVSVMLRLHQLGWGSKRIALELGCSRHTVRRYLAQYGWRGCRSPCRLGRTAGLQDWLMERLWRHHDNADVLRQELPAEQDVKVPLRTVERSVVIRRGKATLLEG